MPLNMWVEIVNIISYLINRGPSTSFDFGTLEEASKGKKVIYSFLRTFICEAFAHVDYENRTKLESKLKKCIFFRYGIDEFGYKFLEF